MNKNNSSENLINNLKKESIKQNYIITKISLLDILYKHNILKDMKKNINNIKDIEEIKESINSLEERIFNNINRLSLIYGESKVDKDLGVEYYKSIRNDIHSNITDLSRYLTEVAYINQLAEDKLKMKYKISTYNNNPNLEMFYKDVYSFLMDDPELFQEKLSNIITILPIKISKNKFFDILRRSLFDTLKDSSKQKVDIIIKRFKSVFNGTLELGYVDYVKKYFRIIQEFKHFDFKSSTKDEIKEVYLQTKQVIRELEILLNYFRQLGMLVNKFIIINLLKDSLNKDEKKDIISFIDNINNKTNNYYIDSISKLEKDLFAITTKYQNITRDIIEEDIIITQELENTYRKTELVLGYLKDYYIEKEELLFSSEGAVNESYLNQSIENLINFIDRNIKSMSNKNRKVRMKKILTLIDIPFKTPEDFFDYIKSSIEFDNDKNEVTYIMNEISKLMSKYKRI